MFKEYPSVTVLTELVWAYGIVFTKFNLLTGKQIAAPLILTNNKHIACLVPS